MAAPRRSCLGGTNVNDTAVLKGLEDFLHAHGVEGSANERSGPDGFPGHQEGAFPGHSIVRIAGSEMHESGGSLTRSVTAELLDDASGLLTFGRQLRAEERGVLLKQSAMDLVEQGWRGDARETEDEKVRWRGTDRSGFVDVGVESEAVGEAGGKLEIAPDDVAAEHSGNVGEIAGGAVDEIGEKTLCVGSKRAHVVDADRSEAEGLDFRGPAFDGRADGGGNGFKRNFGGLDRGGEAEGRFDDERSHHVQECPEQNDFFPERQRRKHGASRFGARICSGLAASPFNYFFREKRSGKERSEGIAVRFNWPKGQACRGGEDAGNRALTCERTRLSCRDGAQHAAPLRMRTMTP